ncbi:hypothetical protein [Spirosoma foliorum]|nr:hypothetical protein [Spirosoma foliorum]
MITHNKRHLFIRIRLILSLLPVLAAIVVCLIARPKQTDPEL